MKQTKKNGFTLTELMVVVGLYLTVPLGLILLMGLWTERNAEFMLTLAKHGQFVDVPYWLAALASIPLPLTFVFNLVSEFVRLIVS